MIFGVMYNSFAMPASPTTALLAVMYNLDSPTCYEGTVTIRCYSYASPNGHKLHAQVYTVTPGKP
jgi:hypothetical protein